MARCESECRGSSSCPVRPYFENFHQKEVAYDIESGELKAFRASQPERIRSYGSDDQAVARFSSEITLHSDRAHDALLDLANARSQLSSHISQCELD